MCVRSARESTSDRERINVSNSDYHVTVSPGVLATYRRTAARNSHLVLHLRTRVKRVHHARISEPFHFATGTTQLD